MRAGRLPGNTHTALFPPERSGKGQWAKRGGRGENRGKGGREVSGWIERSHRERERGREGLLERGGGQEVKYSSDPSRGASELRHEWLVTAEQQRRRRMQRE